MASSASSRRVLQTIVKLLLACLAVGFVLSVIDVDARDS